MAASGTWYLQYQKDKEDGKVDFFLNGRKARTVKNQEFGALRAIQAGKNEKHVLVLFDGEKHGRHLNRDTYKVPSDNAGLVVPLEDTTTNEHFISGLCDVTSVIRERRKRSRSSHGSQAPPRKRVRLEEVTVVNTPRQLPADVTSVPYGDADVQKKFVGKYTVSVMSLQPPPLSMQVRSISRRHVDEIKTRLQATPTAHVTAIPVVVNDPAVTSLEDLQAVTLDSCRMITLGGNHLRTACQELLVEFPTLESLQIVRNITIHLFLGLSPSEARLVAALHNAVTETLPPSFIDKVTHCRRVLFELAQADETGETPDASPDWKKKCWSELGESNKSMETLDTVFHVAAYSKRCWDKLQELCHDDPSHTSLKQTVFHDLRGISEEFRFSLLSKVGAESFQAVAKQARAAKKLARMKDCFLTLTKTRSWEDAQTWFPEHAQEELLNRKFNAMTFKEIPEEFVIFCQEAVDSMETTRELSPSLSSIKIEVKVTAANGQTLCGPDMKKIIKKYERSLRKDIAKKWDSITFA